MQTVQTAVNGVDPRTGRTVTGTTAGVISGKYLPVVQARLKQRTGFAGEALMPIYDDLGNLTAYERSMAPEQLSALNRNEHLGDQ